MSAPTVFSSNGVPYARLSRGGPRLVVLTGSELIHQPPTWTARLGWRWGLPQIVRRFEVYLTSRRPDLPRGCTARDLADDVAELIRTDLGGGPVHLMGVSSGGSSAMHLAADHPDLVDRLVLAMTAFRLNEHGRRTALAWRDLALAGSWTELYARMGVDVAEGRVPDTAVRVFMRVFGRLLLGTPASGADLAAVLDADLGLDVADRLPEVTAPTLVVGGDADPFYGADNIIRTARLVPHAELRLLPGGHAVVKQRRRQFQACVLDFLLQPQQGNTPTDRRERQEQLP